MAEESEVDTSRARVETYVPAYQRDEWDKHAEELGMSRSEFIRTMVQAGRSKFNPDLAVDDSTNGTNESANTEDLETQVIDSLSESDALGWEELLSAVTGDIETRLEDTLNTLQSTNRIQYSGPMGGYVLNEEMSNE